MFDLHHHMGLLILEGSRALEEKGRDVTERTDFLEETEKCLAVAAKDFELRRALLQQEKEEPSKLKLELQNTLDAREDKKKQVDCGREKLETIKSETNELSVPELIIEEVDTVRLQRVESMAEEDRLKVEKAKYEPEWELIDEKIEELRRQAKLMTEGEAVSRVDSNVYGKAASNLVSGNHLEGAVWQILAMGGGTWDRGTVVCAVCTPYTNSERAVEYLYSGIPEQAEVAPLSRTPVSAQAANPPAQLQQPAQPAPVPSSRPNANPLDLFSQVLGAASIVAKPRKHPVQLKDDVSSPSGTTIAGIHQLEKAGILWHPNDCFSGCF